MRLLRLDLIAFGPFTEVALDFGTAADRPGLHLVYGPNEAGKSSTLRALRAALFGFPHQTGDDFFHHYQKLRVGATLQSANGQTLSFVRRKGKKNTLLAGDGQTALADDALVPYLNHIREDEFFSMFAIGHAELRVGGREVLQGHGRLGETIFMATAGLPRLRRVEQSLADEAGKLFLRNGKNPAINHALIRIADLRRAQKEKYLRPEDFTRRTSALEQAREERKAVEHERAIGRRDKVRLDRIAQALPTVARLRQYRAELESLGKVPRLPEGFSSRRDQLERDARSLAGRISQLQDDLLATETRLGELTVPDELLAAATDIERMYGQVTVHEKAIRDAHRLQIESTQLQSEAAILLKSIQPDLVLADAASLRLTRQELATIRELSTRRRDLELSLRKHDEESHRLEARILDAVTELERLGADVPVERPKEILRRAAREGDLNSALVQAEHEIAALMRQFDAGRSALPFWSGTSRELAGLPVPSAATIDRFEVEFAALDQEGVLLRKQRAGLEKQLREAEQSREREERDGDVPSLDALQESRRRRDAGWREIRRELDGRGPGPDREIFLADGSEPLPEAYETAVEKADAIADRLRVDAERVERHLRLKQEAERIRAECESVTEAELALSGRRDKLQSDWAAHWPFLSGAPSTPREMRDWSSRHGELMQIAEQQYQAEMRAKGLRDRVTALHLELARAFEDLALAVPEYADFRSFIDECERTITRLDVAMGRRQSLTADRQRAERDRREIDAATAATRDEIARVQADWANWMMRLGLPPTSGHDAVHAFLDTLAELFARIDRIEPQRERIDTIHNEADAFAAEVRELAERLDPEIVAQPYSLIIRSLYDRLVAARSLHDSRSDLLRRREKLKDDLADGAHQTTVIAEHLRALCRQAGCDDAAELPAIEQRAAERHRVEVQIEQTESELCQRSGGRPIAEFLAEIESVDADAIEFALEQTAGRLDELEHRRDELVQTITAHEQELSRMSGGADAVMAAEDTEVVIARLAADIEHYARLKFASKLLRDGRERFQQKSGNAVLDLAGNLFSTLTDGHFSGLAVDYSDNDEPRLVGVRAGAAKVHVDGMSDGTADQLYLALRLAGITAWLERHEPLPLVLDDILVHFDDARSTAALQTLSAMGKRTQIVLFTHHRHIVELAQRTLGKDQLCVHSLDHRDERESAEADAKPAQALF